MMRIRFLTTTALALGLLLPGAAYAQQQSGDSPATKSPQSQQSDTKSSGMDDKPSTSSGMSDKSGTTTGSSSMGSTTTDMAMTKDQLVGKTLYGANDEEVGEIEDVVMGSDGNVESALVDVGSFLGIGGKKVAIPADQIEMQGDKLMASGLTKQQVEQMPEAPESQ